MTMIFVAFLVPLTWWSGRGALVHYDLASARRAIAELDLERARSWLQVAEQRQPERPEIHFLMGVVHRRTGRYRPAKECFERAERLGWFEKDLQHQRNMLTFQLGYLRKAEPYLKRLLERDCSDELAEDVYESLVMGYLAEFRVIEGKACLDYWVEWRPESVRARIWRAQFHNTMMDPENEQAELREVLRLDPRRIHERLWLAQSLLDRNQVNRALVECEMVRRQAPGNPRVQLMFGLCHFEQGGLDEARRELESAAASSIDARDRLQALVILGQIASASQDYDLAARRYEEATKIAPNDSAAHYGLGTVLSKLGNVAAAERHLQRSRVLENQASRLADINSALIKAVDNVELRLEAARILLDEGRKTEAAVWMLSALRYDSKLRAAHEFLAEYFDEQGEGELARSHLAAARAGGESIEPEIHASNGP
jgi:tetratricopeptide (TPR) repeat protein